MKCTIIDNYDSFTYNLVQLFRENGFNIEVVRNDLPHLELLDNSSHIILSPGPGLPSEAGKTMDIIERYKGRKPILGVCLGEQAIAEYFGAKLMNLPKVMHGIQSELIINREIENNRMFNSLEAPVAVGRYHSWAVERDNLPECLEITAATKEGTIMGIRHKYWDIEGIQFHPESILTPQGGQMIRQWAENPRL